MSESLAYLPNYLLSGAYNFCADVWNRGTGVSEAQKLRQWQADEKFDLLSRAIQDKHDIETRLTANGQEIKQHQMTLEEHKLTERRKKYGLPLAYVTEVLIEAMEGEKGPGQRGDYSIWRQAEQEYKEAKQQTYNTQTRIENAVRQSTELHMNIEELQKEICRLNTEINLTPTE